MGKLIDCPSIGEHKDSKKFSAHQSNQNNYNNDIKDNEPFNAMNSTTFEGIIDHSQKIMESRDINNVKQNNEYNKKIENDKAIKGEIEKVKNENEEQIVNNNQVEEVNLQKLFQYKCLNENIQLKSKIKILKKKYNNIGFMKEKQSEYINEKKNLQSEIKALNKQNKDYIDLLNKEKNTYYNEKIKLEKEKNDINNRLNENILLLNQVNNEYSSEKIMLQNKITKLNNYCEKLKEENKEFKNQNKLSADRILILENKIAELSEVIIVGLDNIGATCYMNATLQSLSNTEKLTDYFLKEEHQLIPQTMSYEYQKVVKKLWNKKNNKKSYAPHSFKELLSKENSLFEGINANDSKDLINFLLEKFHQELNSTKANNTYNNMAISQQDQLDEKKMLNLFFLDFKNKYCSIISDLFYGVMETKSQCQGCNLTKYNFQIYSFIEFPLEQVNMYCIMNGLKSNNDTNNPDVSLGECFNYYCKTDLMNGDNQMYCNICKANCNALYSTNLYSLPNNLIINLNRGKNAIYQCNVKFPEKLNLFNFVSSREGNTYFELYAVISHIGPSSMSGHFIAYCKHKKDKKWYKYNDSFVEPCQQKEEFRNGMPYILFYQAL